MGKDGTGIAGLELQYQIAASPDEVFDALTNPAQQRRWLSALGPDAGSVETTVDLRIGGTWEATFRATPEIVVHDVWTYREIDAPRRIVADLVSESTFNGMPGETLRSHITFTFTPVASGTLVAISHAGFPSEDVRAFFENVVWPGGLARIEALLTGVAAA